MVWQLEVSLSMQTGAARKNTNALSLVDKTYFWLKNQIITNAFPAGALIDDREIMLGLGVSRTPVRDAIRLLHSQGYLEVLPRKATRVAFLKIDDMRHVYQLITALEVQAVSLLAERKPGEAGVAPLRQAVADMRTAKELSDWHAADERFHRALLELCGNPRIASVALESRDFVQRAHLVALRLRVRAVTKRSTEVHSKLVDLIAAGDLAGAQANHLDQRTRMENDLIGAVESAGLKAL
jgi:DNA-binding GntR family transcriptional regulator